MNYRPERQPPEQARTRRRVRGARLKREPKHARLSGYAIRHAQVLVASLGRLWHHPVATSFSVAVIGIALALPAGMTVFVGNVRALSGVWDNAARISVFLNRDVTEAKARQLQATISRKPGIKRAQLITAAAALAEFRQHSGFGAALDMLDHNPLPAVLVVTPLGTSTAVSKQLASQLKKRSIVARVRVDTQWIQRLAGIIDIIHRAIVILAVLFGLAVVIIIGNTIRLDIQSRRREIEVSKLIGATHYFIRRPFLYTGLWYGLAGGIAAWVVVAVSLWLLDGPVRYLAGLYGSTFSLQGLNGNDVLILLLAGATLGWLGSWFAVARHLGEIEPS